MKMKPNPRRVMDACAARRAYSGMDANAHEIGGRSIAKQGAGYLKNPKSSSRRMEKEHQLVAIN